MPRRTLPAELLALLRGGLGAAPDPLPSLVKQVKKLPLDRGAVWRLLTHPLSAPGAEDGLPTVVVLLNLTNGALLYQGMLEDTDTADLTRLVLETIMGVCGYEGGNLDHWPPASADSAG